jgi:2,3-bisphosphoglycerate-independent phosphoglycerate mutase
MAKKCIMILLDGLGDRSYVRLNHRTPLQAARTPVLDRIAALGANGLYHAGMPGQALPSENAHFAMFGYPMEGFPGRGALEALGAGIPLDEGAVALLAHFVAVHRNDDGALILDEGKPKVTDDEIRRLIHEVGDYSAEEVRVKLHHTHGFRGILTLEGRVGRFITDSDPIETGRPLVAVKPWHTHAGDADVLRAARVVGAYLAWVYHTLRRHPVNAARQSKGMAVLNGLVTQRAGRLERVTPFGESYGLRGLSIASGIVYHGLAAYLGMGVRKVADTADPAGDLARRLEMALGALADHDFIHVHTKMPDEAAHTKDPLYKTRVIEALDRGIGAVIEKLRRGRDLLLVVAADHSTPSSGPLIHSGEPVPLIFLGEGLRRDGITRYDEVSAAGGALGFIRGRELMYTILNHLDRSKLQGLMDTPLDQPYWPGTYEPFRVGERV